MTFGAVPNLHPYLNSKYVAFYNLKTDKKENGYTGVAIIDPINQNYEVVYDSAKDRNGDLPRGETSELTVLEDGSMLHFTNTDPIDAESYIMELDLKRKALYVAEIFRGACYGNTECEKLGKEIVSWENCVGRCGDKYVTLEQFWKQARL